MSDNIPSHAELARFQRTVATCLSIIPVLFAGQCLTAIAASRTSQDMFRDFGAKLPTATQIAISWRPAWLALAIILPLAAIAAARIKKPISSVVFSTTCALVLFAVAQFLTYSTWLPFTELMRVLSK